MNSTIVTTSTNATASTDRHSVTTEVFENSHVFLEDSSSATFTEWEDVPVPLQNEMAKCIQDINRATARLQELILRAAQGNGESAREYSC